MTPPAHYQVPLHGTNPGVRLLEALWGCDAPPGAFYFWQKAPRKVSTWFPSLAAALAWLDAQAKLPPDLFFGIALAAALKRPHERIHAGEAAAVPGLWADVDLLTPKKPKAPPTVAAAREVLDALPVRSSIMVSSGGGIHVYPCLKEPWILSSPEERARAARLCNALQAMIRSAFSRRGWALDYTADLSRVLRLPGSTNLKYTPSRPVEILFSGGPRYSGPEELEDLLAEWNEAPGPRGVATAVGEFTLDPAAEPPRLKLALLLDLDRRFRRTWERRRSDLKDQSPSGYCLSLADAAAAAGWSDQEIVNLLLAWRRRWVPEKTKLARVDWFRRTIQRARTSKGRRAAPVIARPTFTELIAAGRARLERKQGEASNG